MPPAVLAPQTENDLLPNPCSLAPDHCLSEAQAAELTAYLKDFPPYTRPAGNPKGDPPSDPRSHGTEMPISEPETSLPTPPAVLENAAPPAFQNPKPPTP